MKFHKNVSKETRELLMKQLEEYEREITMSFEERKVLHRWVASGRSPYDNGDYICGSGGYPLDFISALHSQQELEGWFEGLSEEEKQDERCSCHMVYNPATEEPVIDISTFIFPMEEDEELPF